MWTTIFIMCQYNDLTHLCNESRISISPFLSVKLIDRGCGIARWWRKFSLSSSFCCKVEGPFMPFSSRRRSKTGGTRRGDFWHGGVLERWWGKNRCDDSVLLSAADLIHPLGGVESILVFPCNSQRALGGHNTCPPLTVHLHLISR